MIKKKAFTLIEILVVVTIIGLLAGAGAVTYSQFIKQSRDARRKADLELMRSAIEQYRTDKDAYPGWWNFFGKTTLPEPCNDAPDNPCYMTRIPTDPKSADGYSYYYHELGASSYRIAAHLETIASTITCGGNIECGIGKTCNYCLGPYGEE